MEILPTYLHSNILVGLAVGLVVGTLVGLAVGLAVGDLVGTPVRLAVSYPFATQILTFAVHH